MVNYANAKVYKIWSPCGNKIYVGSTTKEYLSQRMDHHRGDYKRWKNGKRNNVSSFLLFEEYGIDNCFIELLELKECISKDELSQLEGKYIRQLECVNKKIEGRTKKEYRNEHKEQMKEYHKEYKEVNKDKIIQYREEHREEAKQKTKEWYKENKEKFNNDRRQKIICECGSECNIGDKSRHIKSIKHCKFIESQKK